MNFDFDLVIKLLKLIIPLIPAFIYFYDTESCKVNFKNIEDVNKYVNTKNEKDAYIQILLGCYGLIWGYHIFMYK